mgnify:CR=1 FL=1
MSLTTPNMSRLCLLSGLMLLGACGGLASDDAPYESASAANAAEANPEQSLSLELLDALKGTAPRTDSWKTGDGMAAAMTGAGSVNIPMLRWAVRLYRDPVTFGAVATWSNFLTFSRGAWMSSEVGSRIYGQWHVLSVAAVYSWAKKNGRPTLAQQAKEWLVHYWAFCKLAEAADGRILLLGMRSAGHVPNPGLIEWLYALAMEGNTAYWEAQARMYHEGLKLSWEYQAALVLKQDLIDSAASVKAAARPETVIPHYGLRTRYHFLRTTGGLAVWCEQNVNGNTAPVMGAVAGAGTLDWLPANGGLRIRQKFETATCARSGSTLQYHGSFHGDQSLPLPGGTVISEVSLPL